MLILGALALGGEYGEGTIGVILTQQPGRLLVLAAKLLALGLILLAFVLAVFGAGALCSAAIAAREGGAVVWPAVGAVARVLRAAWLILAVWAAFGVALAVLLRGVALAVGLGIVYTLAAEGLISRFAGQTGFLVTLAGGSLRGAAYLLAAAFGVRVGDDDGPGTYLGPLLAPGTAAALLAGYGLGCLLLAALVFWRRDVA